MKRRTSLSNEANKIALSRNTQTEKVQAIMSEGWEMLDQTKDSCELKYSHDADSCFALFDIKASAKPHDIFFTQFPEEFVQTVWNNRLEEDNSILLYNAGKSGLQRMTIEIDDIYSYFAVRALIHGAQYEYGSKVDVALSAATNWLEKATGKTICGQRKLRRIQQSYFIDVGGDEEKSFSESLRSPLTRIADVASGDEKLFYFTGDSGFLRQVPNKPAKIGIWHYQLVTRTIGDQPILIDTMCHNAASSMDMSIKTSSVVSRWINLVMNYDEKAILVCDAYYLDSRGRDEVMSSGAKVICAMQPSRVPKLYDYISTGITSSGMTNYAYNRDTKELACYHWSMDTKVGKKLVLSSAFKRTGKRRKKGEFPIYDHYKAGFNGCDAFNKAMYKRTWPFRSGGGLKEGDRGNCFNYFFTSALINTWHIYCALQKKDPKDVDFRDFTQKLSKGIINTYYD